MARCRGAQKRLMWCPELSWRVEGWWRRVCLHASVRPSSTDTWPRPSPNPRLHHHHSRGLQPHVARRTHTTSIHVPRNHTEEKLPDRAPNASSFQPHNSGPHVHRLRDLRADESCSIAVPPRLRNTRLDAMPPTSRNLADFQAYRT